MKPKPRRKLDAYTLLAVARWHRREVRAFDWAGLKSQEAPIRAELFAQSQAHENSATYWSREARALTRKQAARKGRKRRSP